MFNMRDPTHKEQVIRWTRFVRENDRWIWKPQIKAHHSGLTDEVQKFLEMKMGK